MRSDEFFRTLEQETPTPADVAAEVDAPFHLARNVYRLRKELAMTQGELAAASRMSQPRIAKIERGDANPRLDTLTRIAHALGVSCTELLRDPDDAVSRSRRRVTIRSADLEIGASRWSAEAELQAVISANENFALSC